MNRRDAQQDIKNMTTTGHLSRLDKAVEHLQQEVTALNRKQEQQEAVIRKLITILREHGMDPGDIVI